MSKKSDEELRQELADVRQRIANMESTLHCLKNQEEDLRTKVTPHKERCQVCRGSGSQTAIDHASGGYPYEKQCENCKGTGYWTEPI